LDLVTTTDGVFWPIGNADWYSRDEEKSLYDQQPVEASTMASAALAAFALRGDDKYMAVFQRAHAWFLGQNSLEQMMADTQRGTCFDGLVANGVNRNQGAESTLAWLWTEMLAQSLQQDTASLAKPVAAIS
ncbi:MAG: glycosyl transferase, partial [Rhodopirellula sp.]|nr:glycosyl transferase [Rhodopirellula sp.]